MGEKYFDITDPDNFFDADPNAYEGVLGDKVRWELSERIDDLNS